MHYAFTAAGPITAAVRIGLRIRAPVIDQHIQLINQTLLQRRIVYAVDTLKITDHQLIIHQLDMHNTIAGQAILLAKPLPLAWLTQHKTLVKTAD